MWISSRSSVNVAYANSGLEVMARSVHGERSIEHIICFMWRLERMASAATTVSIVPVLYDTHRSWRGKYWIGCEMPPWRRNAMSFSSLFASPLLAIAPSKIMCWTKNSGPFLLYGGKTKRIVAPCPFIRIKMAARRRRWYVRRSWSFVVAIKVCKRRRRAEILPTYSNPEDVAINSPLFGDIHLLTDSISCFQ